MKFFLLLLPFLFSCQSLIPDLDKTQTPNISSPRYCPVSEQDNYFFSNKDLEQFVPIFLDNLQKKHGNISFEERVTLILIASMLYRPDQIGPSASMKIIYKKKQDAPIEYLHFNHSNSSTAWVTWEGLDRWLKANNRNRSLKRLLELASPYLPKQVPADPLLEAFLEQNLEKINKVSSYQRLYLKGGQYLRAGEMMASPKLIQSLQDYLNKQPKGNKQSIILNQISSQSFPGINISCDFHLDEYHESQFDLKDKTREAFFIGQSNAQGGFFLAAAEKKLEVLEDFNKSGLFISNKITDDGLKICYGQNEKIEAVFLSAQSRDPAQHLYHLFQYQIFAASNLEEFSLTLNFSRYLFLPNPLRLLIESDRASSEQMNQLLTYTIPIYQASPLGKIWSYAKFTNGTASILADDRYPLHSTCHLPQ